MRYTTIGQLLIDRALPDEMRGRPIGTLDKKGVASLFQEIAEKHPEKYRETAKRLSDVGREVAYRTGGLSFSLDDLQLSPSAIAAKASIEQSLATIFADKGLSQAERKQRIIAAVELHRGGLADRIYKESLAAGNPLAVQVLSGMRGNKDNLRALVGFDGLYANQRGEPLAVPVLSSFSQGLRPHEYFASAFGARKSVIDTKMSTANAGFFCLSRGTMVRMADGTTRAIEDIRVNDTVLGADYDGKTFPVAVTATFDNGMRPVWRYRFRIGKARDGFAVIDATAQHKALARFKFGTVSPDEAKYPYCPTTLPLGRACNGFRLALPVSFDSTGYRAEPWAGLLGALLSEGGLSGNTTNFSTGDPLYLAAVTEECRKHQFNVRKLPTKQYEYSIHDLDPIRSHGKGARKKGNYRSRLRYWLAKRGLLGLLAPDKFIPASVFQWDNASIAKMLGFLFGGDGYIMLPKNATSPAIGLGMTSRPIVECVRDLLAWRFGIHSVPVRGHTRKTGNKCWTLIISVRESVTRFAAAIPLVGIKAKTLNTLLDAAPPATRNDHDFLYSYVSKELLGDLPTHDIEVDHPAHLFVLANGAIVSNSKQIGGAAHRLIITDEDSDKPPTTIRGLPVSVHDKDSIGALLAADVGPYVRNTLITPRVLARLSAEKHERILVRSPAVGGPRDGIYSRDAGLRDRGGLSPRGDFVGSAAAQAIAEKLTQGQLCLARGTLVRMADWTTRPIETIRAGEWVMGSDKTGLTFPVQVVRTYDNGLRDCWRFGFRRPFARAADIFVVATRDHKALALRKCWGQKAASKNHTPQLLPIGTATPRGRYNAVRPRGFVCDSQFVSHDYARLLGVWLGDGIRVLPGSGVMISCFDDALASSIVDHIAPLGLNFTKMAGHPGQYYVGLKADAAEHDATGRFLPGYRNPLKRLIAEWGLLGKYAHEKSMPDEVFTWDNATIAELLSGLWITDGCVMSGDVARSKPYLTYGSTSYRLICQIQDLLAWRFGIYATGPSETCGEDRKRPLYTISIATELAIKAFTAAIPLHGKRRQTLIDLTANWQVERPRNGRYAAIRDSETYLGLMPTHDLEVDHPDHLFVLANGVIVSNSSKHGGGVAGSSKAVSGFAHVNALIQNPAIMLGAATHAEVDGSVTAIDEAPQGGSYVTVAGKKHYVPPEIPLLVKVGDTVDAGDELSAGIPHPGRLVETKGIGEGRRRFVEGFARAYRDAGMSVERRNIEVLARGLIDHVALTKEIGDGVPGDIVPYHTLENDWTARDGANSVTPSEAVGKYLEEPVLHHTIGTKVTKAIADDMAHFGVVKVAVHTEPPPFKPVMIRAMSNLEHDPDWMTRHLGSNLQRGFQDAVHRGLSSDTHGSSFVPAVADRTNFGRQGLTKGWRPSDIQPVDRDSDGFVFDGTPRERRVDAVDIDEEDDE